MKLILGGVLAVLLAVAGVSLLRVCGVCSRIEDEHAKEGKTHL